MNTIVQQHKDLFLKLRENLQERMNEDFELEILLRDREYILSDAIKENKYYKIPDDTKEGYPSYLNKMRDSLEESFSKDLKNKNPYSSALKVISSAFHEKFGQSKTIENDQAVQYTYLDAIREFSQRVFEPEFTVNARAEWRAYFEYRFHEPILNYLRASFKNYAITTNFAIWTFDEKRTLPVYRRHANIGERSDVYKQREIAFKDLGQKIADYSFVWDHVYNDVSTIFHFRNSKNSKETIEVYEVGTDSLKNSGRGYTRYFGKCVISASSTNNIKDSVREYRNSVVRFLIRTGLFDPRKAARKGPHGEPIFLNLLEKISSVSQKKEFDDVLKAQFNSSRERLEFDHAKKYSKNDNEKLNAIIDYIHTKNNEHTSLRLETFEYGFLNLLHEIESIDHIYWLPILTKWRGKQTGGTIFLNSDQEVGNRGKNKITMRSIVPQELITAMYYFSGLIFDEQIGELEALARPEMEKAAATSIMSRNISHNVGSHGLSYLKALLNNEAMMMEEGGLGNLVINGKWNSYLHGFRSDQLVEKGFIVPLWRSIGRLFGYLQERQDYIGIQASGGYLYEGNVHFQSDILEPFNAKIPFTSLEVDESGEDTNLLLNYIAWSEGYRSSDIEINVTPPKVPEQSQIMFAIPAGITGRHAFYSILENFIRNTSKHGLSKSETRKKIIINISIEAENESFYKIIIKDNSGNINEQIVQKIKNVLKAPLLNHDGTVDEQNKGIKEMQIAAAWLRGISPHEISDYFGHELKILEVDQENKGLSYSFYVKKPKEALFVFSIENYERIKNNIHDKFIHCDFIRYDELNKENKLPYRFVVLDTKLKKEEGSHSFLKIRSQTSVRTVDEDLIPSFFDEFDKERDLLSSLYLKWLDGYIQSDEEQIERYPTWQKLNPSEIPIGIYEKSKYSIVDAENRVNTDVTLEKCYQQPILFRKHNDNYKDFQAFKNEQKEAYNSVKFLEGISGSNSTDRLLREEEKTSLWALKIREAALTEVLIFDERIWRNIKGINKTTQELEYNKYIKKNIHIYSIEYVEDQLTIFDLNEKTIGTITKTGEIEIKNGSPIKFHFIALHQGLLDKILNHCKHYLSRKMIVEEKKKANHIFQKFKGAYTASLRYIIHSGRSKTPIIPAETAFLQLTSLDSALMDCKYTLTELFYGSIAEEN